MRKFTFAGILVLMLMTIAYGARADVLALWLFDEGKGKVAVDSAENGNDGTIENAEYVQGKYGTALRFRNQASVDVGLPDSLQNGIEQAFTAELWIKVNKQPPSAPSTLIFMQAGGPIALGFTSSTGGGLYAYAGGSSKITDPDGPAGYTVGEWFHYAQTYDGEVQKLYFNGEEIASQNVIGAVTHTADAWTIGAWSGATQYWLEDVVLDELRISNEALEPEELGFFNQFSPVEPNGKLTTTWADVKASS